MKYKILILLLLLSSVAFAQNRLICFTFDDMPLVSYGVSDSTYQQQVLTRLITNLNQHKIPAIGFVNTRKLHAPDGSMIHFQEQMLTNWLNHGLDIGNHTYSHPDYNTTSCNQYTADILQGEPDLKRILSSNGKSLRYFRHPFLHVGTNREKADSLDQFLRIHNYTVAPVTIDNEDYLFAVAYKRATDRNDSLLMHKIQNSFIDYILLKAAYYEKQSNALFGRNIPQIVLLHASLLNAETIGLLATRLEEKGYRFISIEQALSDSAYRTPITVYGKYGISWIDKWALSQGKKGDFFKDDPLTPDYINKLAE